MTTVGNALSDAFEPTCQRHDACYSLEEQTQKWCDDQFGAELTATDAGETKREPPGLAWRPASPPWAESSQPNPPARDHGWGSRAWS